MNRRLAVTLMALLGCLGMAWAPAASADPPANKIFTYAAAASNAPIHEYDIDKRSSTVTYRRSCVPNPGPFVNGRGIALGARQGPDQPQPGGGNAQTRVLYNTFIFQNSRDGDGFIHRNELPSRGCRALAPIPFGEGAGPPNQDGIGALDFNDTDDGGRGKGQDVDILYAAGYRPTTPNGFGPGAVQILYEVDGETGAILGRCFAPTRATRPLSGNDSLTFAPLTIDGETREVLLTDFGEFRGELAPDSLAAVDVASLGGPPAPAPAPPCAIVAEFPVYASNGGPGTGTGIDYEKIPKPPGDTGKPDSLVVAKEGAPSAFLDAGQPPFNPARPMGSAAPENNPEDISVDRVNPPEDR